MGDVTDRLNLTPVALHEAMCLARTLFGGEPTSPVHENVPAAVFSQPPVGTVGLTEAQARERHPEIDVYRSRFRQLKDTLTGGDETTLMKMLVDRQSDRVLGVHMVGPEAGEIIQGFAVALKCGATKAQVDATVGVHPTSAEELVTLREPVADA
jgi:glutathione reductase (NADPH)